MKKHGVVWAVFLVCAVMATAQEMPEQTEGSPPPPLPSAPDNTASPAEPGATPGEAPQLLPGDVITLKNGSVLSGVQVLKKTPTDYEVEILEGSVTLSIPRDQVKSIEYDAKEPSEDRARGIDNTGKKTPSEFPGQRISPALSAKLGADLSDQPIVYENADLVDVMNDLSKRTSIAIEVGQPALDIPADQRKWSFQTQPGKTTLFNLLRDAMPNRFPSLEAVFAFDKILVTSREAAQTLNKAPSESSAPAPTPPEQS